MREYLLKCLSAQMGRKFISFIEILNWRHVCPSCYSLELRQWPLGTALANDNHYDCRLYKTVQGHLDIERRPFPVTMTEFKDPSSAKKREVLFDCPWPSLSVTRWRASSWSELGGLQCVHGIISRLQTTHDSSEPIRCRSMATPDFLPVGHHRPEVR